MASRYSVKLKTIIEENGLVPVFKAPDYESRLITTADINRPALQLAGFYDYFDPKRIQIIGRVESTYLELKSDDERRRCFEDLMRFRIPCLVICHGAAIFPECTEMAEKYGCTLVKTDDDTSDVMANIISTLHSHLAPRTSVHGVLVEVHGEGVLLTGDSGIGKSETALELIKRGHRLIADDAVDIRKISKDKLIGSAPELIRYYMELRGIGVVDVRYLYGVGAVKPDSNIDLFVKMETWDEGKVYDRLGVIDETESILGVEIPALTIPVRPGRNLAVIIELAAMNNRQKKMGYNAAETLEREHDAAIDAGII